MNYEKIYNNLCEYCKMTDPQTRIRLRNPVDIRLKDESGKIYTELHHIIPRHAGGSNADSNLVKLLPEEHMFAHLVRYKAFKQREDFLAVRFLINGFNKSNHPYKNSEELMNTSKIRYRIGLFKQMVANFRKNTGWHTPTGIQRISESRKNKIPCVDSETGEKVGMHLNTHPNILSGKWVHHSRGKVACIEKSTGEKKYISSHEFRSNKHLYTARTHDQKGEQNGNYKRLTPDRVTRLYKCIERAINTDSKHRLKIGSFEQEMKKEFTEWTKISTAWVIANYGTIDNLFYEYTKVTGIPVVRFKTTKEGNI